MPTMTTKSTNVTFTREQVNFLGSFMTEKTEEFVSKLLEEDDEDTTEDRIRDLMDDYFTTKGFKIGKAPPVEGGGKKVKKPKKEKDPNEPKRPTNGYMNWLNKEGRQHIKDEYELTGKEINKKAGELWNQMKSDEDETFLKYQKLFEKAKKEYEKAMAKYKASSSEEGGAKPAQEPEPEPDEEAEPELKTYNLSDFESFDELTPMLNKFTGASTKTTKNKSKSFATLEEAVDAMNDDDDAGVILLSKNNKFTLHKTPKTIKEAKDSQLPCMMWVKDDE